MYFKIVIDRLQNDLLLVIETKKDLKSENLN